MAKKQISKDVLEKISKVLQMSCEKDFECSKVGSCNSCTVAIKEYGLALEVFRSSPSKDCKFMRQNGFRYFCDCPIHFYVRKGVNENTPKRT